MSNTGNGAWRKAIAPYEQPDLRRSIWQLVNSCVPFFALWYGMYRSLSVSYWLTLALALPTAGLLVRIFIIFHDCCHGSFFKSRKANAIVGTITGILTLCPYSQWRHSHNVHHAHAGDLDHRGDGDIWTLTVDEYLALPRFKQLLYRFYRNPLVMFGLGPIGLFVLQYRFNRKGAGQAERINTWVTNAGIVGIAALLCWLVGWQAFLLVHGPVFLIAGAAGVWLFYVQHQFEGTYYAQHEEWDFVKAALQGSSFYKLPKVLQWFTGNIGFHHIHHLSPRVPNYLLERTHAEVPMFQEVEAVTLLSSLRSLRFRMWDEYRKTLVGFGYVKQYLARRTPQA
jgi:acyl-lipid omega-6 desaturase (Delta-12 desaturase)